LPYLKQYEVKLQNLSEISKATVIKSSCFLHLLQCNISNLIGHFLDQFKLPITNFLFFEPFVIIFRWRTRVKRATWRPCACLVLRVGPAAAFCVATASNLGTAPTSSSAPCTPTTSSQQCPAVRIDLRYFSVISNYTSFAYWTKLCLVKYIFYTVKKYTVWTGGGRGGFPKETDESFGITLLEQCRSLFLRNVYPNNVFAFVERIYILSDVFFIYD